MILKSFTLRSPVDKKDGTRVKAEVEKSVLKPSAEEAKPRRSRREHYEMETLRMRRASPDKSRSGSRQDYISGTVRYYIVLVCGATKGFYTLELLCAMQTNISTLRPNRKS